jgi:hypothetical protein
MFGAGGVRAQAGPPFLTNDPGTPGNANWEINLGSMQSIARGASTYQVPQIDLNAGVGDRIQLTYQVPYVVQTGTARPTESGWGNGYPGIKWRFLDQGEDGWQMSVFPQVETGASLLARQKGIGVPGPRYVLPVQIAKGGGFFDVDVEAGYYIAGHGPSERILGLVIGRKIAEGLELDAEIYDDHVFAAVPRSTTLDVGGRYRLRRGILALFMAGRSIDGTGDGQPEFIGYLGIQMLLSNM